MNIQVRSILGVEQITASSEITVPVPVSFDYSIYACEEHKMAYVKFSAIVKKRLSHIVLNNEGHLRTVIVLLMAAGQKGRNLLKGNDLD